MADISTDLVKKIRRIQYQTNSLANDVLAGSYRSAFRGKGMEFEEVREYQPGDDIRTIDWNVTARANRPFVKTFREERELTVTLVVDVSASTRFGSKNQLKSDLVAEVAAVLAFSAIKNNDKVALILFSDTVELFLPPKKGTRHVLQVIRELLVHQPQGKKTDMNAALTFLGNVQQRSSICFLISDFICTIDQHQAALIANKHDLVAISIVDPAEKQFPPMDLVTFQDLENNSYHLIDTSSKSIQNQQQNNFKARIDACHSLMNKIGASYIELCTDKPYMAELKKFFSIRQMRRQ